MADIVKKELRSHFVLVHGTSHGAWCSYKIKPILESAGHRVTALDLAASGINPKEIQDVPTFYGYTEPLLKLLGSLPQSEKVILVGHSYGGMSLALAMEIFPHKISVAVFLAAFMPDTVHRPSFVLERYSETMVGNWLDTQFSCPDDPQSQLKTILFGPELMAFRLYQNSPFENLELAKTLVRPSSLYLHDLSKQRNYSEEKYGSVRRVYIVCDEDEAINLEFQKWNIANYPVDAVMEIHGADHMAMFSKPFHLCRRLSEIALTYV